MYNKKFSKEPTAKQKLGQIGEDYACKYMEKNGYNVLERNYLKKWGEIDIVCKKNNKIHFIEVKSVSRELTQNVIHETSYNLWSIIMSVVRSRMGNKRGDIQKNGNDSNKETHQNNDSYRPEDNMHPWKLQRLGRAVQSYLLDRNIPDLVDWQFDIVTVYIDSNKGLTNVFLLEDIVL